MPNSVTICWIIQTTVFQFISGFFLNSRPHPLLFTVAAAVLTTADHSDASDHVCA